MSGEIHRADWSIPYPDELDEKGVATVLRALTHVEHDWDAFPWHLVPRLVGLLEVPEATFEYLHVTVFFCARAAMLALTGDVLDRKDLFGALSRHRVQAGGIYRQVLLGYLRTFLTKNNMVQLPECEAAEFDHLRDHGRMESNRELIRRVVGFAEAEYVNTLNFISLASDMTEEIGRHPVGFWVEGGDRPAPIGVPVRICRHEAGHDWTPGRDEAKAALQARRPVRKVSVRPQGEFGFVRGVDEDRGPQTRDQRPGKAGKGRKSEGRVTGWKVVGDYHAIVVPGHSKPVHLANRQKARSFLRFLCARLAKSGESEFYVEEVREEFNAQFPEDVAGRRWVSDRFREDLFRGKEREFDLLFERLDKGTGRYRVRGGGLNGQN